MRRAGLLAAVLVLAVLAAGTAVVLRSRAEPLTEMSESAAVYTPIGTASSDQRQPATLRIRWDPPVVIGVGTAAGRVTAIPATSPLRPGEVVVEIDGNARPALIGGKPPWRNLEDGVTGRDVAQIGALLADLGYAIDPSIDTVDSAFRDTVGAFEEDMGWVATGVFRPDYVIWIPDSAVAIGSPLVAIGQSISPETPLFEARPTVASAQVGSVDPTIPLALPDGELAFSVIDGPVLAVNETTRQVDGNRAPLIRHAVSRSGAELLTELPGTLQLTRAVRLQTVPSEAIIVSAENSTCIELESGSVVDVTVIGGRSGITEIGPTLDPAVRVRQNPDEDAAARCS